MGARHVGTQVMTLIAACKDAILFVETLLDKGQMSGVGGLILLPRFVALCGAILFSFSLWVSWRKCCRGYAGIQRKFSLQEGNRAPVSRKTLRGGDHEPYQKWHILPSRPRAIHPSPWDGLSLSHREELHVRS